MLELELNLKEYKRQGIMLLLILIGVCLAFFAMDFLLRYMISVKDDAFLTVFQGIFIILMFIVGVSVLTFVIPFGYKIYKLSMFQSNHKLTLDKELIKYRSPLDFGSDDIKIERIQSIKAFMKENTVNIRIQLSKGTLYDRIVSTKDVFMIYVYEEDYHKFKKHIIDANPRVRIEEIKEGKTVWSFGKKNKGKDS